MKSLLDAVCVAAIALVSSGASEAKGCIKGAVVGGVAGHMGGHGKLGAAAAPELPPQQPAPVIVGIPITQCKTPPRIN